MATATTDRRAAATIKCTPCSGILVNGCVQRFNHILLVLLFSVIQRSSLGRATAQLLNTVWLYSKCHQAASIQLPVERVWRLDQMVNKFETKPVIIAFIAFVYFQCSTSFEVIGLAGTQLRGVTSIICIYGS